MKIKNRGKNKQLAINMMASVITFLVGLGIRFLLTPYVVKSLGAEAYGFIGLASNILSYTGLITIALNSMAGRFITIKYVEGNIEEANKYFSSVFYSNLVLAGLILVASVGCVIWLEYMIVIPSRLLLDVKFLFSLLALNNIIGLITSVWGVSTFIKNRLDLSNIRGIIGNVINVSILVVLFGCFAPHIWYMGIAGMALTLYSVVTNFKLADLLTPDLKVKLSSFDLAKVIELLKAGVWNLVSKLGEILGQGLDLVIANICIGTVAMGYFALTRNLPFLILSLFQTISSVFAPSFTALYAEHNSGELLKSLKASIRILGFLTTAPLAFLYVFGDNFYALWLPTENSEKLQLLTMVGTLGMTFAMPLEALWNIFTITNKLKYSTFVMLGNNILVFATVMLSMLFVESTDVKMLILAGSRSAWGFLRSLTFLPLYGAYCLKLPKLSFYPPILKSSICLILTVLVCFVLKSYIKVDSWMMLFVGGCIVVMIAFILNSFIVLTHNDRKVILQKIKARFS